MNTGAEKCYRIDPEELLLYSLTRIKTGMTQEAIIDNYFGGDYARWTHGHRWLMLYLDMRYASIFGHEGILRFLPLLENSEMLSRHIARRIGCISIIRAMQLSLPA